MNAIARLAGELYKARDIYHRRVEMVQLFHYDTHSSLLYLGE